VFFQEEAAMAGRGPAPKDPSQRVRRNKEVRTQLNTDAINTAPALPGTDKFSAAVNSWYQTWVDAPQAQRFTGTDWQRLHFLAPLVEAYFQEPKATTLSEIRINESLLGATEADRQRLRWDLPKPEQVDTAKPDATDWRGRLRVVDAAG
jgi:hypothetical protein